MRSKLRLIYREPAQGEHVVGPVLHILAWERIRNIPNFGAIVPIAWALEYEEVPKAEEEGSL